MTQQLIEQCRFAAAEKAGDQRDRQARRGFVDVEQSHARPQDAAIRRRCQNGRARSEMSARCNRPLCPPSSQIIIAFVSLNHNRLAHQRAKQPGEDTDMTDGHERDAASASSSSASSSSASSSSASSSNVSSSTESSSTDRRGFLKGAVWALDWVQSPAPATASSGWRRSRRRRPSRSAPPKLSHRQVVAVEMGRRRSGRRVKPHHAGEGARSSSGSRTARSTSSDTTTKPRCRCSANGSLRCVSPAVRPAARSAKIGSSITTSS